MAEPVFPSFEVVCTRDYNRHTDGVAQRWSHRPHANQQVNSGNTLR